MSEKRQTSIEPKDASSFDENNEQNRKTLNLLESEKVS